MILTFRLSGTYLTMKMARGFGWGPLVLPPLSGDRVGYMTLWQGGTEVGRGNRGDGVVGFRGSQERFLGQLESWMKGKERVGGWRVERGLSVGQTPGPGAEGLGLQVVEEEPICLGGKLHRRTSWVERALHREGLLQRAQKAWAYGTSDHLSFCLRKLVRF